MAYEALKCYEEALSSYNKVLEALQAAKLNAQAKKKAKRDAEQKIHQIKAQRSGTKQTKKLGGTKERDINCLTAITLKTGVFIGKPFIPALLQYTVKKAGI